MTRTDRSHCPASSSMFFTPVDVMPGPGLVDAAARSAGGSPPHQPRMVCQGGEAAHLERERPPRPAGPWPLRGGDREGRPEPYLCDHPHFNSYAPRVRGPGLCALDGMPKPSAQCSRPGSWKLSAHVQRANSRLRACRVAKRTRRAASLVRLPKPVQLPLDGVLDPRHAPLHEHHHGARSPSRRFHSDSIRLTRRTASREKPRLSSTFFRARAINSNSRS